MTEYGSGGDLTVIMEGPFSGSGGSESKISTISAPAENWKGGTSPYSQVVAVEGVSVNTKVEIQLSVEQIQMFRDKGYDISFTIENEDGIVTLFAIGSKPDMDCEFQVALSGVIAV
ncbi:MAG: hypothetical protein IIW56_06675 [Oscillospiraceae bacterium]|nr:hypothetical protein [Oscillospiraceae bacterium]